MTGPSGRDVPPEKPSGSSASEPTAPAIVALWIAWAGHLLVLLAAMTDAVPPNTTIVAAIACSIIAVAALTELAPDARARRAVKVLAGGHGVAAAILLAGIAPVVPRWVPLAGLAAAAALGVACLAALGRASTNRPPRLLTFAPRVAAIALVVQALLGRAAASTGLSMPFRAAIFLSIAALGIALLVSLSIIVLRVGPRWVIAAFLAWTVGWVATTADVSSLILGSLGGPVPEGLHPLRLDAELVQILATVGGIAIGVALVTSIRDARFRHSAVVLLAGYAVFGVIAAVAEHRIELATDFPSIAVLRRNRDLAAAINAFALAGVLWLYWRRVVAPSLPRATTWDGT